MPRFTHASARWPPTKPVAPVIRQVVDIRGKTNLFSVASRPATSLYSEKGAKSARGRAADGADPYTVAERAATAGFKDG